MADLEKDVAEAWNEAERSIQQVQVLSGYMTVPAVNELRHAGRSLSRALGLSKGEERERYLIASIEHCRRASMDAVDVAAAFISTETRELVSRFGYKAMPPTFLELRIILSKLEEGIVEFRIDRSNAKKYEQYSSLVFEAIAKFQSLRGDLEILEVGMELRARRKQWLRMGSVSLAFGLSASALAFLTPQLSILLARFFSALIGIFGLVK